MQKWVAWGSSLGQGSDAMNFKTRTKAMNYQDAIAQMRKGHIVARRAWCAGVVGILADKHSQFVLLLSHLGVKHWEPYFADFSAVDWYVYVPGKVG